MHRFQVMAEENGTILFLHNTLVIELMVNLLVCFSDGEAYRLYNLDVYGYKIHDKMGIYGSVPYLLAHKLGRTLGIFWLNSSETLVEINTEPAVKVSDGLQLQVILTEETKPVKCSHSSGLCSGSSLPPPVFAVLSVTVNSMNGRNRLLPTHIWML